MSRIKAKTPVSLVSYYVFFLLRTECINLLTPRLNVNVLTRVSQILVVITERRCCLFLAHRARTPQRPLVSRKLVVSDKENKIEGETILSHERILNSIREATANNSIKEATATYRGY